MSKLSIHNHIDHRHVKVVASKQGKFSVQYEDPAIHHDLLNEDENWNKDRGTSAEEMIEVEVVRDVLLYHQSLSNIDCCTADFESTRRLSMASGTH